MSTCKMLRVPILVCALMFASRDSRAQEAGVIDFIGNVYVDTLRGLVANPILVGSDVTATFNPEALLAPGVLGSALVYEIGGFPIGSSSGGFTYVFDPTTGGALRSSPSFGPAFAERPLTSGRGKLNVGFSFLHRSFDQLEGHDLEDGSLKFYSTAFFADTGDLADLIESSFDLNVTSDTATFFVTYGVMNKLDLALAVPVQHLSIDARVTSQLVRFGPSSQALPIESVSVERSLSATGLGDIAVRAKYNVISGDRAAIAAGLDVRLPTGDEADLLGTGRTRTKLYAAMGSSVGKLFPHANVGYTFKSGSQTDTDEAFFFGSEASYTAGAEYVVHPRVTVVGDIIGRSLAEEGRLQRFRRTEELTRVFATYQGVPRTVEAESRTVEDLRFEPGLRLNSVLGAIGAKFSPTSTLIISAHVLFPMMDAGLKSRPTPVVGVDYTF